MQKLFSFGFWNTIAGTILRNRIFFIGLILGITVFLITQWKYIGFSYTEANLLPDKHPLNVQYQSFLEKFGNEGNVIVIATQDTAIFTKEKFKAWAKLSDTLRQFHETKSVIDITDLQNLMKFSDPKRFEFQNIISQKDYTNEKLKTFKSFVYDSLPFYDGLVYNSKNNTIQTAVYIEDSIVNSSGRKDFVLKKFIPLIDNFSAKSNIQVHVSGMPYVRTLNTQTIIDEIKWFVLAALLVTSLIFYFFFRSFRATLISMITVIIGVIWAFGIIGLLHYEITVLTAIIPPLIIVIGIPNCIFLINKYQQEIKKHGNQAKSLQRVIAKIGNATLMTNVTTASGFATFMFTQSELLKEFGLVASLNIISIFLLSLLIIPIVYSYMSPPKEKHLKHLGKKWIEGFVNWIENMVRHRKITIYFTAIGFLVLSLIGINFIKVSGSLLEDMPQKSDFVQDIYFFEEAFNGIMPLEFLIDTQRENGVSKLTTLKRIERLGDLLEEFPETSKSLSVVNIAKYSKQAFYNGKPKYYQLPTSQEQNFMMPYFKNFESNGKLNAYVDSTGRYARLTVYMKDVGTKRMEEIEAQIKPKIAKIFPDERYEVSMTGKALTFQKGTKYLVNNLVVSLSLAVLLIAVFMAWMFRSFRMILISIIPNMLPLLMTAGMMGFLGVPIKPSTILVFSIAFGISVDDTIHFLAKYRQELKSRNWKIRQSVYPALRETTVSMFYTSVVLYFGFSVFMISSYGGTVALGGLVSATLLFAMLSNLLLLPSLLLSLERNIANKKTLRKPLINIIESEEDKE
jgi:predicted RND superfamily exporter protein